MLSPKKRKQFEAVLAELQSREVELPEDLQMQILGVEPELKWPFDENGYSIKSDGGRFLANPKQDKFYHSKARFVGMFSARGGGKALAIDTPIPTKDGWTTMEDIQIGETLFDEQGNYCEVLDVHPIQYFRNCYRVKFSDGSEIVADEEHLWTTLTAKARSALGRRVKKRKGNRGKYPVYDYKTFTTAEIKNSLIDEKRRETNHSIDCAKPLAGNELDLWVDPYLLGLWLGDGDSSSSRMTIGKGSEEIVDIASSMGFFVIRQPHSSDAYRIDYVEDSSCKERNHLGQFVSNKESLHFRLRTLDLINNKHIPKKYLRGSYDQRLALLQGLMDTDGYVDKRGKCEFCSTNIRLAVDVYELLMTLGYKISVKVGAVKLNDKEFTRYRLVFTPNEPIFRMSRKLKRVRLKKKSQHKRKKRRFILAIEEHDSVPVRCITVDSPSKLYLAGTSFIPTHNSATGAQKANKKISQGEPGAVLNPTFEDFKTSTWPEFRNWIPWDMVIDAHQYMGLPEWSPSRPFTLNFKNGAFVICKGLSNPDSARGPNINWLWYDEARNDLTGDAWKIAIASVRIGNNPQAWVTTTPRGKAHWLYKFFIQQDIPEEVFEIFAEKDPNRDLIEYVITSIDDNKDNLDPGFYASLLAFYDQGWLRKQEVDGEFVDQEGVLGESVAAMLRQKVLVATPTGVSKRVRYWDMGATEKKMVPGKRKNDPDETLGTKMSFKKVDDVEDFYIEHQTGDYKEWDDILDMIVTTALEDGPLVQIIVEEEPGSGGKNQVAAVKNYVQEHLPGWPEVKGWRPEGDRVILANVWFAEAKAGNVYVVSGDWNKKMIDQVEGFPILTHDDKVTSVTGARFNLSPIAKWKKVKFLKL